MVISNGAKTTGSHLISWQGSEWCPPLRISTLSLNAVLIWMCTSRAKGVEYSPQTKSNEKWKIWGTGQLGDELRLTDNGRDSCNWSNCWKWNSLLLLRLFPLSLLLLRRPSPDAPPPSSTHCLPAEQRPSASCWLTFVIICRPNTQFFSVYLATLQTSGTRGNLYNGAFYVSTQSGPNYKLAFCCIVQVPESVESIRENPKRISASALNW